MSFSARIDAARLEYNGTSTRSLFAQKRNVLRPRFWSMIRDILRFYREAHALLESPPDSAAGKDSTPGPALGDVLARGSYGAPFIDWHMVPMACAVWSAVPAEILNFPARSLVRFFANHGFLQVADRPAWRTIEGGSRTYANTLLAPLQADGCVRTRAKVTRVASRSDGRVDVATAAGSETFDRAVLACHADQALEVLDSPTTPEREILGAIRYQPNEVVLHTDPAPMPKRKRAWAAWNVWVSDDENALGEPVRVTYWMNPLQRFDGPHNLFVSLGCSAYIDPSRVLETKTFHHPVFDSRAIAAQSRFEEIDGVRGIHYCGAYWHFGFHEDGVQSARRVLERLGVDPRLPARDEELRPGHTAAGRVA